MRFLPTPEMKKLKSIFEPYMNKITHRGLIENAPDEAVNAYEKYFKLVNEKYKQGLEAAGLPVPD